MTTPSSADETSRGRKATERPSTLREFLADASLKALENFNESEAWVPSPPPRPVFGPAPPPKVTILAPPVDPKLHQHTPYVDMTPSNNGATYDVAFDFTAGMGAGSVNNPFQNDPVGPSFAFSGSAGSVSKPFQNNPIRPKPDFKTHPGPLSSHPVVPSVADSEIAVAGTTSTVDSKKPPLTVVGTSNLSGMGKAHVGTTQEQRTANAHRPGTTSVPTGPKNPSAKSNASAKSTPGAKPTTRAHMDPFGRRTSAFDLPPVVMTHEYSDGRKTEVKTPYGFDKNEQAKQAMKLKESIGTIEELITWVYKWADIDPQSNEQLKDSLKDLHNIFHANANQLFQLLEENSRLDNTQKGLTAIVDDISHRMSLVKQESSHGKEKYHTLLKEYNQSQEQLKSVRAHMKDLNDQIHYYKDQLEKRTVIPTVQLQEAEMAKQKYDAEAVAFSRQLMEAQNQQDKQQTRLAELVNEKDLAKKTADTFKLERIAESKNTATWMKKYNRQVDKVREIERERDAAKAANQDVDALKEQVRDLQDTNKKANAQIKTLENKIANLQDDIKRRASDIQNREATIAKLRERPNKKVSNTNEIELTRLRDEVARLEYELETQKADAKRKIEALEANLASKPTPQPMRDYRASSKIDHLYLITSRLERELASQNSKLAKPKAELSLLEAKIAATEAKLKKKTERSAARKAQKEEEEEARKAGAAVDAAKPAPQPAPRATQFTQGVNPQVEEFPALPSAKGTVGAALPASGKGKKKGGYAQAAGKAASFKLVRPQ
ncbi:hypothetical protein BCR34DRAFT_597236 [Clohesyomyces aquaticus]|uniref:Uncharacterized protein n=1 Tax=Clohesyomyces aquaticus TaxID=1231657 RepID=A0A1Y2A551_9PLEO|nr:hypothetical protein BCR34DRAFT_597236 [Clohesyomyces aquaticus]